MIEKEVASASAKKFRSKTALPSGKKSLTGSSTIIKIPILSTFSGNPTRTAILPSTTRMSEIWWRRVGGGKTPCSWKRPRWSNTQEPQKGTKAMCFGAEWGGGKRRWPRTFTLAHPTSPNSNQKHRFFFVMTNLMHCRVPSHSSSLFFRAVFFYHFIFLTRRSIGNHEGKKTWFLKKNNFDHFHYIGISYQIVKKDTAGRRVFFHDQIENHEGKKNMAKKKIVIFYIGNP